MKQIGILCAGDTELAVLLPYVEGTGVIEKAMLVFHCRNIDRVEAVLLYSGVCKMNAAIVAQLLIDCFAVDCIINAGTARGMQEQVQLFSTVISEKIAYHDVANDILTEFHPWVDSVYFYADENLLQSAKAYSNTTERVILFGTMVSGEQSVTEENREQILTGFIPLCTDMETVAVVHICYVNKLPFLAIRTITSTAEHKGIGEFERNCAAASAIPARIVCALLPSFCGQLHSQNGRISVFFLSGGMHMISRKILLMCFTVCFLMKSEGPFLFTYTLPFVGIYKIQAVVHLFWMDYGRNMRRKRPIMEKYVEKSSKGCKIKLGIPLYF